MASSEYKNVIKKSENKVDLIGAHKKIITADQARDIVYSYLDETEISVVKFTSKRARGFASFSGWIRLPKDGCEYLTLGITLHEIAHIIVFNKEGKFKPHGKEFIKTLDQLVYSESCCS